MMDQRWRVLVVDDSPVMTRLVESVVRQCGIEKVSTAQDGVTALRRLRESPFDLVLCDWEMAPVDGLAVLRQVRQDSALSATRFILMSGKKDPRWVIMANEAGADSMIAKPFTSDALMGKIKKISMPKFVE